MKGVQPNTKNVQMKTWVRVYENRQLKKGGFRCHTQIGMYTSTSVYVTCTVVIFTEANCCLKCIIYPSKHEIPGQLGQSLDPWTYPQNQSNPWTVQGIPLRLATMCLATLKASLVSGDHTNSFFVLRSGRRGAKRGAIVGELVDSWLARPMKERRSVRFRIRGGGELCDGFSNGPIDAIPFGTQHESGKLYFRLHVCPFISIQRDFPVSTTLEELSDV